jgi:hypothetical protein
MRGSNRLGRLELKNDLVIDDEIGTERTAMNRVIEYIESLLLCKRDGETLELVRECVMITVLRESASESSMNGESSSYYDVGKLLVENRRSLPSWHRGVPHIV